MRRLFFALWPNDETRKALAGSSRPLLRACDGRPVPPERYHVTLAFLGEVPDARVDRIPERVSIALPAFSVVFDRVGFFGRRRGPRVLWIGPSECPEGLAILVARLRVELDRVAVHYDQRDFKPHMTLVRKVTKLPELERPRPVVWPVRDFVLVESMSGPAGPAYEVLRRYSIDGSGGLTP